MGEAENRLKSRGMERPTLFVEEENEAALGFYEKRGWSVLYKVFCLEKEPK
jgi:ribosomal protein S18 acetylase RimI-like enzyme